MKSSKAISNTTALAQQYNDLREDAQGGSFLYPHEKSTPNMTVYVENGAAYFGNKKVSFAGGYSPTITAPSTNPRIDLLVMDNTGTLSLVTGTEAASPAVPTYPTGKIVICEIYNRVGESSIKTLDDTVNGYIQNDVRAHVVLPFGQLYDAIVDANGAGDYTTLSAAVSAGALRIFVKSGTYAMSSNLSLSANTWITGEDWQSTILSFTNAQIQCNANFITIRNIQITGYKAFDAMVKGTGDDVRIEHCQVLQVQNASNNNDSFNLSGQRNSIVDCYIQSTNNTYMTGAYALFHRNRVVSMDKSSGGNNCRVYLSGDDATCSDNIIKITDSGAGYLGYGIDLEGLRAVCTGNRVIKTDTNNSGQFGIFCNSYGGIVADNFVLHFQTGIAMYADYKQTCSGNICEAQNSNGIYATGYTNTGYGFKAITGNTVYSPGNHGISIDVGSHLAVVGNTINGAGGNGIDCGSNNCVNCIIQANTIGNCTGHGIFAQGGSSNTFQHGILSGNMCRGNSGKGIYGRWSSAVVVGNSCFSNTGTNFDSTDVGGSQIANNITS